MMGRGFFSLMRLAAAWVSVVMLSLAACYGQNGGSGYWSSLNLPDTFIKSGSIEKNAPRSILMIGEIHNSVKIQKQIAELLDRAYQAHQIDAILVEGSAGVIDGNGLRQSMAKTSVANPTIRNVTAFWRGQLEFGHLAGYEYVAVTRNNVQVFGVEDMLAKAGYTIEAEFRLELRGIQHAAELYQRGYDLAQQANGALPREAAQAAGVNAELKTYNDKISAYVELAGTARAKYTQALETAQHLNALYRKILPIQELISGAGGSVRRTEAEYKDAFARGGYTKEEEIAADVKKISAGEKWFTDHTGEFRSLSERIGKSEKEALDQFFIVANAIRRANGAPVPSLQTFLRDERERGHTDFLQNDPEVPYLAERDRYMVENTRKYFVANPTVKRVVLIVGAAHLQHMTELFRQENVNLLAGSFAASTIPVEAWEARAWLKMDAPAKPIFFVKPAPLPKPHRNRKTVLQDINYRQDVPLVLANIGKAQTRGMPLGNGSVFEVNPGTSHAKTIIVTAEESYLRANWGPSLVGSGRMPDNSGKYYLIIDRVLLKSAAKKASTSSVLFLPVYRTRTADGKPTLHFDLPTRAVGLDEFKRQVPSLNGKVPERVVLAVEGDARPVQEAIDGSGPPFWPNTTTRIALPPESRGPRVLYTKNTERARAHMDAMEKQEPLRASQIASFQLGLPGRESSRLDDLWFTPERGDHQRAFLIVGDNVAEFRESLIKAADAGLLRNKQIALATCFDPKETDDLRERLLEAGALSVWTPGTRISPEAALEFQRYMEKVDANSSGNPPGAMDEYIDRALELWQKDAPQDSGLKTLLHGSHWTKLRLRGQEMPDGASQGEGDQDGL